MGTVLPAACTTKPAPWASPPEAPETIAPSTYTEWILANNNKHFGNKQLKIRNRWGIDTTKHEDGECPHAFAKHLFNNGFSLETLNQKSDIPNEKVKIFNPNISYSHRTNYLHFTGNVTWSIDGGQTWQKLHDT